MEKKRGRSHSGYFSFPCAKTVRGFFLESSAWEPGSLHGEKAHQSMRSPQDFLQWCLTFQEIHTQPPAVLQITTGSTIYNKEDHLLLKGNRCVSLDMPVPPDFRVVVCPANSLLWWVQEQALIVHFSSFPLLWGWAWWTPRSLPVGAETGNGMIGFISFGKFYSFISLFLGLQVSQQQ